MKKFFLASIPIILLILFLFIFYRLYETYKSKSKNFILNKEILTREIIKNFPELKGEKLNLLEEKTFDINKDKAPEILIDLGIGGAAVDNYIFVTFKNNSMELLKFKTKEGRIKSLIFNQGTGGAGRYGFSIGILEEENVIYQLSFLKYDSKNDYCLVDAYKYDDKEDLYKYDENLSFKLTTKYCKNISN